MRTSEQHPTEHVVTAIAAYLDRVAEDLSAAEHHILGSGATRSIEDKMRRYFGMPYAVAMCNGTSALLAAEVALGLRDSELITSSLLYGASLSGALFLENRCVLVDVDDSMNLSAEEVRKHIRPRTKAILAPDFNGVPADMEAIRHVADEFGLWYIADAAQSFGAKRRRCPAGALADVLITSFTCGKSLFAGEGAVLLTRHPDVYERVLWHSQHPCRQRRELGLHLFNEFGLNFRIHPLGAVWADAVFESSLQAVRLLQEYWLDVLRCLENPGLIKPCGYSFHGICPSYFRVIAHLQSDTTVNDIREHFAKKNIPIEAQPFTYAPVSRDSSEIESHQHLISKRRCPHGETLCKDAVVLRRIARERDQ